MNIDFHTLKQVLPRVIRARTPVLIRGPHGTGKSELVKSFDKNIAEILYPNKQDRIKAFGKADYVYPIVERRASQMADAGDIMGLPFLDGEATKFKPMAWFYQACKYPVILFVDEIDRGNQDVRQAFFEMTDSRTIAGHTLHPDTIIFACINGGSNGGQYQVGDMDPAELSRWTVFDAKPSVNDWLEWSKEKVVPQMWDFIKVNPSFLEHNGEFETNKVYPSRRSWVRLNKALMESDNLIDNLDSKENLVVLYHLIDGYLGTDTASAFQDYCKNYKKQVSVEDIVNKGDFKHVKKFIINEHMALIDKFEEHELFKNQLDDKQLQNVAQYLKIVDPELAMKAWEIITRKFPQNGITIHSISLNGQSMGDYFAKLNGGT